MSYSTLESAILVQLRTLDYYNEGNCLAENAMKAFSYAIGQGETEELGKNVCVIDYGGGYQSDARCWTHRVRGFCAIRATEEIEGQALSDEGNQLRTVSEQLLGLFYPNNRLAGAAPRCELIDITEPFAYSWSNWNWLAFLFNLEVDEERVRC